ncbi:M1 family metallopeptidase [Pelagerythrobacter rhizovicinus]|uniref:Aminopeptidase N n=1 Tax=Pelagerythrobacter rhizovicinus TaxID=2268576 RepID=A0A4Q2KJD9_9SPHN|nr:M1 family metallopeptidase [Pelagerythrobacter rhizovicinus]RXZ65334.1 M1 family peptidase [Pelagerythrobacter rhizovicinus]
MRPIAAALSLLLATTACTTMEAQPPAASAERMVAPILTTPDAVDSATFAQPQVARVTHVALDLALDFERDSVGGTATLDILARPDASQIVLDSDGLQVSRVTDGRGNELEFEVGERVKGKGAPLTITIGNARRVVISYTANPQASALQWLDPEQTAGGEHPFLFSQGQAIHNRSWIPTQDSPGIRQTWEARITAPKPLDVVMSGILQGEPEDLGNGRRAFRFLMDKPVAPYLIAIAAGDIDFRAIGPRTGVWAEPAILERAHWEVADTEDMVEEAEELYGPYRWGRYDMIVLPPAFPYGGMENPVMTFLTPTFIAGDRSLTGLVAHELAHSWSGNLVTNAVWADSWLNEGVTSYFENRIIEEIYGEKRAEQEAALSFAAIEDTLAEVGADAPGTALHQPDGTDSAGSAIVYDKGAAFLRTLEREVGRERFDAWLRQWFDNHAFEPATSAMIYEDMRTNLARSEAEAERLRLREWIYEPGLPANVARPDPAAFATVDAAAASYGAGRAIPSASTWRAWSSAERQRFLRKLPRQLSAEELAQLDRQLGLSGTGNNEELFLWLDLALANRYEPAVPKVEAFLAEVGRAKFVRPLFVTLMEEGDWGQPIAQRIYAKTRPSYHAVTRGSVDKVVDWKE